MLGGGVGAGDGVKGCRVGWIWVCGMGGLMEGEVADGSFGKGGGVAGGGGAAGSGGCGGRGEGWGWEVGVGRRLLVGGGGRGRCVWGGWVGGGWCEGGVGAGP